MVIRRMLTGDPGDLTQLAEAVAPSSHWRLLPCPCAVGGHESARCRPLDAARRSTRVPGDVSRGSKDSAGGNRLGRRPPLPPDHPVDPRVTDLAVHDPVFPQRPFAHEPEPLHPPRPCDSPFIGPRPNPFP